jgi:tetratricopeptide (TPR) repeat protein
MEEHIQEKIFSRPPSRAAETSAPDIARPKRGLAFTVLSRVSGVVALVLWIAVFYLGTNRLSWVWWFCAVLIFVGVVVVFAWQKGAFTWMRIANRPGKLYLRGDRDAAQGAFEKALEVADHRFGPDDHRRGLMLFVLADYSANMAQAERAEALFQEALRILARGIERRPFEYFYCLNNYCAMHLKWKRYSKGHALAELASQVIEPHLWRKPLTFPDLIIRFNLAVACILLEQLDDAEHICIELATAAAAAPWRIRRQGPSLVLPLRARLACARGRFDEALHHCAGTEDRFQITRLPRCQALVGLHRHEDAAQAAREALAAFPALAPEHPVFLDYHVMLADCLLELGKTEQAEAARAQALAIARHNDLLEHPFWVATITRWGKA